MSSVVACFDHFKGELRHAVILSLRRLTPCCDRCSHGLVSIFLKFKKINICGFLIIYFRPSLTTPEVTSLPVTSLPV